MNEPSDIHRLAFEAFGLRAVVHMNRPEDAEAVMRLLPPGWAPCDPSAAEDRFEFLADAFGNYEVTTPGIFRSDHVERDLALLLLASWIREHLSVNAPDLVFVHAGVVAHDGRAIVIPGESFSGKTTLVAALVREGAVYYSDEFAVLDREGLVHPYAKPLSLRDADQAHVEHDVASLGGSAGEEPLPVGVIALTQYSPDARWEPRRLSAGEGALAVLAHTRPAHKRPQDTLKVLTRAIGGAVALQGERGEAADVAPRLLEALGAE